MSKTPHSELDYIQVVIDLQKIDPSPYQHRRHFDEDKLRELAASIQREGLIEPIVVRSIDKRYQLIAGERRFRAVRDFTEMETIQAQIVIAGDLQARRISAAENLQREHLSVIETIEAIVEIVDAELMEDIQYLSMGEKPADRVKTLLGKLDSVRRSEELGHEVASEAKLTSNKFIASVERIFKNLSKPMEWLSVLNNTLPLLVDFCEEVQEVSTQLSLTQLGLDPECKWTQGALAQKLGVIQQTINSWISDIRACHRASRKHHDPLKPPCLSAVFLEGLSAVFLEELDPGADCGGGGVKPKQDIRNYRKYQF